MSEQREHSGPPLVTRATITGGVFLLLATTACVPRPEASASQLRSTLRIGVAQLDLNQLVQIFTIEGLAKIGPDGRPRPWMAEGWTLSPDGLSLVVALRPNLRFHDNSPVSATVVADILREKLPAEMGPAAEDLVSITPLSHSTIEFKLRRPMSFLLESLEIQITKPGMETMGTGPFVAAGTAETTEVRANAGYYQGRPTLERVRINRYPSVRTAWADLLRNNLDMVYEVGVDALDSLQTSTTVNVFSFTRNYQYVVFLNTRIPALRSPAIRRALNASIDRDALIREGLDGHGVPSELPVAPWNWAAQGHPVHVRFDPVEAAQAVAAAGTKTRFTCLVAADDERLALVVQRQLAAIGVEMILQEGAKSDNLNSLLSGQYEALLATTISGPSMFRLYPWWHSKGSKNTGFSSSAVDAALDGIRGAISDDQYRAGVAGFQQAILDDPPAIFLAWNERARAVSKRFEVPAEPGVDMMGTLRLWRLTNKSGPVTN